MVGATSRRKVIETIINKTRNYAKKRNKKINTIDPIIKNAKKEFPYFSEKEIKEYSITALRIILNQGTKPNNQSTLINHLLDG
jgi:hypothetical protein